VAQDRASIHPRFTLRAVPWWTDGCSTFLSNLFKWLPGIHNRELLALEFGGGNSTFYMLGKNIKVVTVESDENYIQFLIETAQHIGFKSKKIDFEELSEYTINKYDLIIIKADSLMELGNIIGDFNWDIIVNDGISRREVLAQIHRNLINAILILDNVEYSANWGRLDRGSAKPDLIKVYRSILRDKDWAHIIFEQPEGREGRAATDKTGWEAPHRWASAVLWPSNHLLAQLMVSNIGMPIVNELGVDDTDTDTLTERCPFDWEKMKWLKPQFPPELDLKLKRNYE